MFYGLSVSMTKLSRDHFAALLSSGITSLTHKFACVDIRQKVCFSADNFLEIKTVSLGTEG